MGDGERKVRDSLDRLARAVKRSAPSREIDAAVQAAEGAGADPNEINDTIQDAEGDRDG